MYKYSFNLLQILTMNLLNDYKFNQIKILNTL